MSIYVVHYKEFRQNGRNLVTEAGEVGVGEKRIWEGDQGLERERARVRARERARRRTPPPPAPRSAFLARSTSHCSPLHRARSRHPPDSLTRIPSCPPPSSLPPSPPPLQLIVTDNPHDTSGLLAMVTSPTEKLRTLDNIVFYAQVRRSAGGRGSKDMKGQ
jgi:hypothetical protein